MSLTNKLCNPTPFDVSLNYEKGVELEIKAFGSTNLTMQQLDDYRDGKPGSENVQEVINYFGLFLHDSDRPYNNQAVKALKASLKAKADRLKQVREGLVQRSVNLPGGGDDIDEQLNRLGFAGLRSDIETLKSQIKKYEASITENDAGQVIKKFDPTRTIVTMDPPTEFPSKEAMEFFLEQPHNAQIKKTYETFLKAQNKEAAKSQGD